MKLTESKSTVALVSDKDLLIILEAFSLLHFCPPPNIEEVIQLQLFYWARLDCYYSGRPLYWTDCSDMRTIVLATMNNILSEKGGVLYNIAFVHELFNEIDKVYNLNLGLAILSLASKSHLKELAKKDYPFLRDYKHCLLDPECSILANVTRHLTGRKL